MFQFYKNWMEFFFFVLMIIGVIIALTAPSAIISYIIIFLSGMFAGRLIYEKKNKIQFPYFMIIAGFVIGYLILLITSCAQKVKIEPSTSEDAINEPGIRTTKVEVEETIKEQPKVPILTIVSPKDNELIKSSKVTVELQAENFNIVPIGDTVKDGEGHFHVWLDSDKKVTTDKIIIFENNYL